MDTAGDDTSPHGRLKQLFDQTHGYLRRKQAVEVGVVPRLLSAWVNDGRAERVQRGLYRDSEAPPITNESLIEVALRIPIAVVCLRSALAFHELGTISPAEIDLAIPNKSRTPTVHYPPVRFYFFSAKVYRFGIQHHDAGPAVLKVYSPEKTLADLLYYKNKLGTDVFTEGLQAYVRRPGANPSKVMEVARVRRVQRQMRTYLEALG